MKKFYALCLLLLFCAKSIAEDENNHYAGVMVPFTVKAAGPGPIHNGSAGSASHPRTPMATPTVYLDGHTLLIYTEFEETIEVQLLDPNTLEDDEPTVVYSTTLTAGDDEIMLPSTYTGEYGIRLVVGNWYYIGYIVL